jgi:hypothetical protein
MSGARSRGVGLLAERTAGGVGHAPAVRLMPEHDKRRSLGYLFPFQLCQQQLGQIDGHRVFVNAVQAALGHQPAKATAGLRISIGKDAEIDRLLKELRRMV